MNVRTRKRCGLAKRKRKSRRRATPAEKSKARNLISKAYKQIGADVRGRKEKVSSRLRSAMAKAIQEEFISASGESMTPAEARDLSKRLSLAGVAKKQAARARGYHVDAQGRFRDDRKGRRGRFLTAKQAKRMDKVGAYWASIRLIAKAQGVSIAEARRAYSITGPEPWEKVTEGDTP